MHWFPKHGKSMDTLRADVKARLEGGDEMTQEQFEAMLDAALARRAALGPSGWAAGAWEKAKTNGVLDGSAPQSALTREQAALVLERLGLLS